MNHSNLCTYYSEIYVCTYYSGYQVSEYEYIQNTWEYENKKYVTVFCFGFVHFIGLAGD